MEEEEARGRKRLLYLITAASVGESLTTLFVKIKRDEEYLFICVIFQCARSNCGFERVIFCDI